MALVRNFVADRSKQVRRRKDGSTKQGCGDDRHILFGRDPSGAADSEFIYRSLVRFAHNWSGVKRVVKAELVIRVEDDSSHFALGAKPKVRVFRLQEAFAEGTGAENTWTSGEYEWPGNTGYVDATFPLHSTTGLPIDGAYVNIDVTALIKQFVPKSVLMPDGTAGAGGTNYGWLLRTSDENNYAYRGIAFSQHSSTAANRPFIRLTYDPTNRAPTAPTLTAPAVTDVSFGDAFEGTHQDPDLDPMAARDIEVWLKDQTGDTGKVAVWKLPASLQSAGSDETQLGTFSVPLSLAAGSLKLQTEYEWRARTKDPSGLWGPFSAVRLLRITSSAPTVVATPFSAVDDIKEVLFGGTFSDPESDTLAKFVIQMQALSAHNDAAFADSSAYLWTTGETLPTADEVTSGVIARLYGGKEMPAGDYTYRIRAQDSTGVWSNWSYDDFELTTEFNPEPGDPVLTTQVARIAPVRIRLNRMGTLRGIGALIGYIDDPMDLGGSAFLNSGGEMYFSLPALHPYVPEVEPHRTHYAVEQYYGDRYAVKFAGIITDFDADPDTVTFYGTDYLGLLMTAVDERYNPDKPDLSADGNGGGGSRYPDKTLDFIIKDQLRYHKALSNSPVGFITLGTITALAERATIYSTYTEALPFIGGLIDSHKQGTGRECRFYARPTSNTYQNWEWALIDNWGKDRPNIRLEYGGLLNDFRVVALGDFGTRILGVGQKRGESKVYRAQGPKAPITGLAESDWGRRAQTRFYQDIIDQADLQRRVNEDAMQLSKVGKRMALAIRADMLSPFDGWDLGDSIVIDIERGAVDSSEYGSGGYWTIYGVEWRYFSDGHTDLTLTVLPKKGDTPPDPDLIPSINPGVPLDWQVGYGVPTVYGDPPSPTPESLMVTSSGDGVTTLDLPLSTETVIAQHYEDLNTGCIYELDEVTGNYTEVYCPDTGGGPGPGGDTTPPDKPVIKSTGSQSVTQDDGTSLTNIVAVVGYTTPPAGLTDLDSYLLESTRYPRIDDPTQPDWTLATQWTSASADATGTLDTNMNQPGVHTTSTYWLRVYALDKSGNRSIVSDTVEMVTVGDSVGPPLPSGVITTAGMSSIGVRWDPIEVEDLSYVEVQWRDAALAGTWQTARVDGTLMVITGLTNDTTYDVRVRSVDTSGNTLRDTGVLDPDGNPIYETVKASEDEDAGWVDGDDATPSAIPGNALVWDEAIIEDVFAGMLSADWLVAGTLTVGSEADGQVAAIQVVNATGDVIGRWSTEGIEVLDPDNPGYKLIIDESSLRIFTGVDTAEPVEVVSLTPLGIDAASITFGSARGGHNLIQNSSFELGAFGVTAITNHLWDVEADWTATRVGTDINLTIV